MKNFLKKLSKIISNILFWILMGVIILLVFYIVTIKIYAKQNRLDEIKFNMYTILTTSMEKTIMAGDVVVDYKNKDNIYELGDIITFYSNRGNGQITITHRIIDIKIENGKYFYSTKGDNNNTADTHYVSQDDVIGKVIFVIPKVGFIQEFILSKVGWIVVIVIPCVGIVVYDLLKVLKIAFNKKKQPKLSKKKLKAKIGNGKGYPMKRFKSSITLKYIKLNRKNVKLAVGKSYKLKVKHTKVKVKWSSKNKKIATVTSKGVVKAKKPGSTIIVAKVKNKKLKCKVTVRKVKIVSYGNGSYVPGSYI